MREIEIGAIYRHFKGNLYKVVDVVLNSEDDTKKIVIYEALYGEHLKWGRDLDMFLSEVDKSKYKDVNQKYRFEKVEGK